MGQGFGGGLAAGLLQGFVQAQTHKDDIARQEKQQNIQHQLDILNSNVPDEIKDQALHELQALSTGKKSKGGMLHPMFKRLGGLFGIDQQGRPMDEKPPANLDQMPQTQVGQAQPASQQPWSEKTPSGQPAMMAGMSGASALPNLAGYNPSTSQMTGYQAPAQSGGTPLYSAPGQVSGMVERGNIDLRSLPVAQMGGGQWGTVRSMSIGVDGKEVLIPTIINGKPVSEQEAIAEYQRTGRHLGVFDTPQHADAYAQRLHSDWEAGKIAGVQMPPQAGGTAPVSRETSPQAQPAGYQRMLENRVAQKENLLRSATTPFGRMRAKEELDKAQAALDAFAGKAAESDITLGREKSYFQFQTEQGQAGIKADLKTIDDQIANGTLSPEEGHRAKLTILKAGEPAGGEEHEIPGSIFVGKIDKRTGKPYEDAFGNLTDEKMHYTWGKDHKLYPKAPAPPKYGSGELNTRIEANEIIAHPEKHTPEEVQAAKDTIKDLNDAAKARTLGTSLRIDAAATQKSDADVIADGIMAGTDPPDLTGLGRSGLAGRVRASLDKKGFNFAQASRDWRATQRLMATLNGPQQVRLRQAVSVVSDSVPKIRELYDAWTETGLPGGFKDYNKVALIAASKLPGEAGKRAQTLLTQINDLTSEMGVVYMGGNSPTEEALRLAATNLQGNWNPGQFNAALDQLEKNIQIRQNSINNTTAQGVTPGSPYLTGTGAGGAGAGQTPPPQATTPTGGKPGSAEDFFKAHPELRPH